MERRRKISESRKDKHPSEETRNKMRISHLKIPLSEYHCKSIAQGQCGPKSHNWKGGISYEPYCPKFTNEFKERVRAFFGYQCQMCGHVWQEGERKLAVHHVNFRKDSCCSNEIMPLFVPLCHQPCHTKTNFNRVFWEYWFTEMINHLYGGKCYFTKEEFQE